MEHDIHTRYLRSILTPKSLKETVKRACEQAYRIMANQSFDAIAFCGMSGAGVAFPMSIELGMPTIMVRKEDQSHYVNEVSGPRRYLEGALDVGAYVIVDEQIATGRTITTMMARIAAYRPRARCVGIILYDAWGSWDGNGVFSTPHWMRGGRSGVPVPPQGFEPVPVHCCGAYPFDVR